MLPISLPQKFFLKKIQCNSFWLQVSAWRILKETCSYIKRLHREVDDLSERLSHLLDSLDNINGVEVEQLRTLLHHQ